LEEIVAAPVKKTENTTGGIHCADDKNSQLPNCCATSTNNEMMDNAQYICQFNSQEEYVMRSKIEIFSLFVMELTNSEGTNCSAYAVCFRFDSGNIWP
jgi:hypothetical protein